MKKFLLILLTCFLCGNVSAKDIEVLKGDKAVLSKSVEALVEFDYSATTVKDKPLLEYLEQKGGKWLEDWPSDRQSVEADFVEKFNKESKGMRVSPSAADADYKMVVHFASLTFGSTARAMLVGTGNTSKIAGTVDIIDTKTGEVVLTIKFDKLSGKGNLYSATARLSNSYIALAKAIVKAGK